MSGSHKCLEAAKAGDLQFLQSWAHQFDGFPHEGVTFEAARGGHLEVLQWLDLQHAALSKRTCTHAAAGGHLLTLQWAQGQGCHWDEDTCAAAARNGHLAVLQFAHQRGCAWSSRTCQAAARAGHLAVLQYAHQHGCEWDPTACSAAAESGNLSILKWLRRHGCPWDLHTTYGAAKCNHLEVLKWASQHKPGCPLPSIQRRDQHMRPGVLVFLWQQQKVFNPTYLAQARATVTQMTYAVLSLRAALPDRTPDEVVMSIVSLAFI